MDEELSCRKEELRSDPQNPWKPDSLVGASATPVLLWPDGGRAHKSPPKLPGR